MNKEKSNQQPWKEESKTKNVLSSLLKDINEGKSSVPQAHNEATISF